jgi:decaprenylphospho-beta-D-erythro-pentofuranosid-2-ulose 2-reductase
MTKSQRTPRKRVVILGALSAIAIGLGRIYAREGAALVLAARNGERLKSLADDLKLRGAFQVETADLDLEAAATDAGKHLEDWSTRIGGIDHVHVIYGYLGTQEKASTDEDELNRILGVNFISAVQWCEATAAVLRKQKRGALVAVSSVAGDRGRQSNYAYGASKGGLALYMQGLAHSLANTGARAVVVKPGFVDTPMTDGFNKGGPLWAKPHTISTALRRAADGGGPIQYAPGIWRLIMMPIRAMPSFIIHKTKL